MKLPVQLPMLAFDNIVTLPDMHAQVMQFDVSNDTVRKQITAELRTLYDSHHAFIVRYYQVQAGCSSPVAVQ